MIAPKPASLSHVDAASVPVIAVTAWQALFDHAHMKRGQTVLIHGAAGSVGAFAVQLAHQSGIRVLATCSETDATYVQSLGADQVFVREGPPFEQSAHEVDGVLDLVGGDVQARSFATLRRGGLLISAVSQPDQEMAAAHGVRATFFLVNVTTERLEMLAQILEAGALSPLVGHILPLAQAGVAHEMLEGIRPRSRGKIVLRVAD